MRRTRHASKLRAKLNSTGSGSPIMRATRSSAHSGAKLKPRAPMPTLIHNPLRPAASAGPTKGNRSWVTRYLGRTSDQGPGARHGGQDTRRGPGQCLRPRYAGLHRGRTGAVPAVVRRRRGGCGLVRGAGCRGHGVRLKRSAACPLRSIRAGNLWEEAAVAVDGGSGQPGDGFCVGTVA